MENYFWSDEAVRLYREGYPVKEAIQIVKEERGGSREKDLDQQVEKIAEIKRTSCEQE